MCSSTGSFTVDAVCRWDPRYRRRQFRALERQFWSSILFPDLSNAWIRETTQAHPVVGATVEDEAVVCSERNAVNPPTGADDCNARYPIGGNPRDNPAR